MSVFIFIKNYQNVKYLRLMGDFENLIRTKNLIPRKHPHLHTDITMFSRCKEIKDTLKFIHGYQIKAISVCGLRTSDREIKFISPIWHLKRSNGIALAQIRLLESRAFSHWNVASCILTDQLVRPDPFDQKVCISLAQILLQSRYCLSLLQENLWAWIFMRKRFSNWGEGEIILVNQINPLFICSAI